MISGIKEFPEKSLMLLHIASNTRILSRQGGVFTGLWYFDRIGHRSLGDLHTCFDTSRNLSLIGFQ